MDWSKWLKRFGIEGGTAVLSITAVLISVIVTVSILGVSGKDFLVEAILLAVLIPVLLVSPLSYIFMMMLFRMEEADIEILRKETQIDYLRKVAAENNGNGSEKEQLIRDLNSFAQTVAHDLKTPLTTILGFATMLADHQAKIPPAQQKEALQAIVKTSLKMNNIIQELMLLAAVRQSAVRTGPIMMSKIVGEAKQRLWGIITENKAEIIVPDATSWPNALGYASWVEEVWINYISNAIKYGGQPPRIELGADANYSKSASGHSMARFWVKDNGTGISAEDKSQLFTQFTRLEQVRAEGHGLGLSIVARVIEKLGGEVGVESEPGQGSTFYFTLPMVIVEPPTRVRRNTTRRK